MLTLKLVNAVVDEPDPRDPGRYIKGKFKTYSLTLDISESLAKAEISKKPKDKTMDELREEIKRLSRDNVDTTPLLTEIHKKTSLAFASFAVVLIALPLAVIARRGEKFIGFGIGLGVIVIFYILRAGGTALALKGALPPILSMWFPNFLLASAGVVLIRLAIRR